MSRKVKSGRLRVDAARAVSKLREYQLPDASAWTLEVARAAILFGARELCIEADADDVWIGWSGPPLAEPDLRGLFDDLVGGGRERRAQRLLATGVNTALALHPRFVDVWSLGERPARVRYTPHLYRVGDEGRSDALRALTVEHVPRPDALAAIQVGGLVHVRRALDTGALARLLSGTTPPEVGTLLAAARPCRVPILALPRPAPLRAPLVAIPLPRASGLRGTAEIVHPDEAYGSGTLAFCELGVVLAAVALELPARTDARLPIRVTIDHDQLPTNAARSSVREGEPLVDESRQVARSAADELVKALAGAIRAAHDASDHARHRALKTAAIAILEGAPTERGFPGSLGMLPHWAAPLTAVPLFRDALGRSRTARELADEGVAHAYRGEAPVVGELAPWLSGVVWLPAGDPGHRLFTTPLPDAAPRIHEAGQRAAARLAHLRKPEVDHRFAPEAGHVAIATFERAERSLGSWQAEGAFDLPGLEGRVAIGTPKEGWSRGEITLLVLRRPIAKIRVQCELPFVAIVTAGTLVATTRYDGLEGSASEAVVRATLAAVIRAAEAVAASMNGATGELGAGGVRASVVGTASDAERAAIARAGMRLAVRTTREKLEQLRAMTVRDSPLLDAPAFPLHGRTPISLRALKDLAAERGALGVVRPGAPIPAVRDRPMLVLARGEEDELAVLCGSRTVARPRQKSGPVHRIDTAVHVVPYDPSHAVLGETETAIELAVSRRPLALRVEHESGIARVAMSLDDAPAELVLAHAGRALARREGWSGAPSGMVLAISDERLVPLPDWSGLADRARLATPAYTPDAWIQRLAAAIVARLFGQAAPGLRCAMDDRSLLLVLARLAPLARLDGAVLAALADRPLLPALDGTPRPFAYFRLAGAGTAGFVPEDTSAALAGLDVVAMRVSQDEARALGELFGARVESRVPEVQRALGERRRARAWEALLSLPAPRRRPPPPGAVEVSGDGVDGWAAPATPGALWLLVEGQPLRPIDEVPRGIEAVVSVERALVDVENETLTEAGLSRVRGAVRDARRRALLAHAGPQLIHSPVVVELALAFLDELPSKRSGPIRALLDALLDAPAFPRLSSEPGARTSIRGALTANGEVRLVLGVAEWIPKTGAAHALDEGAVLAFPEPSEADHTAWVVLARKLVAHLGTPRDVTKEARREYDARRWHARAGGAAVLPGWVDRRFAVPLATLAASSAQRALLEEVLPVGEAAVVVQDQTRLLVAASEPRTFGYAYVPSVLIAARTPYESSLDDPEVREKLEAAVRAVVSEALRWTADHVPIDGWAPMLKAAVRRAALLGGNTHLDRLAALALFPTTAGAAVSYTRLREEVNRFGSLWVLGDEALRLVPLDPDRSALVLDDTDRALLKKALPLVDGEAELKLDQLKRVNLARPEVDSIAPAAERRSRGLGAVKIDVPGGEAWVVPLLPAHHGERGLETFVARRPLGPAEDRQRWPTWAAVDATTLTPDRTHGAPIEDDALRSIRTAIGEACETLLDAAFPASSAPFEVAVDAAMSREALGDRGLEVRGRLRWSGVRGDGEVSVEDPRGASTCTLDAVPPRGLAALPLPLSGELVLAGAELAGLTDAQRGALGRRAYIAVLRKAVEALGRRDELGDLALAALTQATLLGHASTLWTSERKPAAWARAPLPWLAGAHRDLAALGEARRQDRTIVVVEPGEKWDVADAVVIVRSDALACQVALTMLARQVRTPRELLAEQLEAPSRPPEPPPKSLPKRPSTSPPKSAAKGPPKAKAKAASDPGARLLRVLGPIVRSLDASVRAVELAPRATPLGRRSGERLEVAARAPLVRAALDRPDDPTSLWLLALELVGGESIESHVAFLEALARA